MILAPDIQRIVRFRDENGCSLKEALDTIREHQIEDAIDEATTISDLKLIMHAMLRRCK